MITGVTMTGPNGATRGDAENGWRVTPYCYFLLKAKGPQTDALPTFKLNLDFMDTSGYAVLPIESAKLALDAGKPGPARPVRKIEVQQILDERKAAEGILWLEIKATAHGLVPPLDGKNELSTTNKLSIPWARLSRSSTLVRGLLPKRQVPQAWAMRVLLSVCERRRQVRPFRTPAMSCLKWATRRFDSSRSEYRIRARVGPAGSSMTALSP